MTPFIRVPSARPALTTLWTRRSFYTSTFGLMLLKRLRELIQFSNLIPRVNAYPRKDHVKKLKPIEARAYVGYGVSPRASSSMQRIYEFSGPRGKVRVIYRIPQQYSVMSMTHHRPCHGKGSPKLDDDHSTAHKSIEQWEQGFYDLHQHVTQAQAEEFSNKHMLAKELLIKH